MGILFQHFYLGIVYSVLYSLIGLDSSIVDTPLFFFQRQFLPNSHTRQRFSIEVRQAPKTKAYFFPSLSPSSTFICLETSQKSRLPILLKGTSSTHETLTDSRWPTGTGCHWATSATHSLSGIRDEVDLKKIVASLDASLCWNEDLLSIAKKIGRILIPKKCMINTCFPAQQSQIAEHPPEKWIFCKSAFRLIDWWRTPFEVTMFAPRKLLLQVKAPMPIDVKVHGFGAQDYLAQLPKEFPWFWSYFKYILILPCLHTSMLHTMESEAKEIQVSLLSKHTWAAIAGAIDWGRSTLDSGFRQGIKMNQSIGILHWWLWCAFGDWWQWLLAEIGEHGTWWWFCKENAASYLLMGDYDMKLCDKWLASRNTMKYGTRHT